MTRNERRKAAKKRLEAKQERFLARVEAQRAENNRLLVKRNLNAPKPERSLVRSCVNGIDGQSHNAYVCRPAKGSYDLRDRSVKRVYADPTPQWANHSVIGMDDALTRVKKCPTAKARGI